MASNRLLKFIHISSTCWFIASSVFLIIVALREAGLHWWVIFSLSGHSGAFILFLTLVYSFAMFRGVSRSQKIELEHPLTCSRCYLSFYDIAPFLGGAAGLTAATFTHNSFEILISVATGSMSSTFLVWILVDPAVSIAEMLLPASKSHRKKRITEMKELQRRIQVDNERLMEELVEMESINRKTREIKLRNIAADLARLLAEHKIGCGNIEPQVVEMGGNAWRLGGVECMRQLLEMAEQAYQKQYKEPVTTNYAEIWWDGIGTWRRELGG
jgi:hypothetical protein